MARYIDADELMEKIKKCEFDITGCGIMYDAGGVQSAINTQRTADVVPKSEVEELKQIYRRYNKAIKNERAEVAREIFEEIEKILDDCTVVRSFDYGKAYFAMSKFKSNFSELKKKYTEPKV